MRHKYSTSSFVLNRTPIGEASAFVTLITPDLGLIRARVQGIRKPGAKLAPALQTFAESDVTLVRGKEGWRLSGAMLVHAWFGDLDPDTRVRIGRTVGLLLRLVHGEAADPILYHLIARLFAASFEYQQGEDPIALEDSIECLAVLRVLQVLGVDAGEIPGGVAGGYDLPYLEDIAEHRQEYIIRINRGIAASGL